LLGKNFAPLAEKLNNVEWGEFKTGEIFNFKSSNGIFHAVNLEISEKKLENFHPYVVRKSQNNGVRGYICESEKKLNPANTISFAQDTAEMFYQSESYFTGNKVKILSLKNYEMNEKIAEFLIACLRQSFANFSWGDSYEIKNLVDIKISLPKKDGAIDFEFMEKFIAELEFEKISELEAYLTATGLKDTKLTEEEKNALENISTRHFEKFLLKDLFGASTRGKRLKSDDRIAGNLPFVTAGETDEGISAYIGNEVEIFSKNTITIDMFGSAKYRNYDYGADDHIAVVHTEKISKFAAIFVTAAIHKSSHNGQFHYGRNFYAKDADSLEIYLPTKDGEPDYEFMKNFISAVQKIVIGDVVKYSEEKISAYRQAVSK